MSSENVLKRNVPEKHGTGIMVPMKNIGERIRAIRKRLGMTQGDLAERVGLAGHASISKIERGDSNMDLATAVRIAAALRLSVGELVDDSQHEDSGNSRSDLQEDIYLETLGMLNLLRDSGRLKLSAELMEPYARAVARRAVSDDDDPRLPIDRDILLDIQAALESKS